MPKRKKPANDEPEEVADFECVETYNKSSAARYELFNRRVQDELNCSAYKESFEKDSVLKRVYVCIYLLMLWFNVVLLYFINCINCVFILYILYRFLTSRTRRRIGEDRIPKVTLCPISRRLYVHFYFVILDFISI